MGLRLVNEVKAFVRHTDLTPLARLLLLELAVLAEDDVSVKGGRKVPARACWPTTDYLLEQTGVGKRTLARAFDELAELGCEVRVALGTDKRGRPFYATSGHQRTYLLPPFNQITRPLPFEGTISNSVPVDNSGKGGHVRHRFDEKGCQPRQPLAEKGCHVRHERVSPVTRKGVTRDTPTTKTTKTSNTPRPTITSPGDEKPVENQNPEEDGSMSPHQPDVGRESSLVKIIAAGVPEDLAAEVLALAERDTSTHSPVGRLIRDREYRAACISASRPRAEELPAWVAAAIEDGAAKCDHAPAGLAPRSTDSKPRCTQCRNAGHQAITKEGKVA